jgi:hypothetical protein
MRPQSKEYPVKRFIPISSSDRVVLALLLHTSSPGPILGESMPNPSLTKGYTLDQFLTMRYNTGLTAAPDSLLYGSSVCKWSPIQVLTVLNAA